MKAKVKKIYLFMIITILLLISLCIWYWFVPINVKYVCIGNIDIKDSMDDNGYIPCRDDSLGDWYGDGYFYYIRYYGLSPVDWQGVDTYVKGEELKYAAYSSDIKYDICFENFLEQYLTEHNEKSIDYFISWGRPIDKISYQRRSKSKSNRGHYVGTAVFADVVTEPKVYIYKVIGVTDIEPHYDIEHYEAYPVIRFKDGLYTNRASYPYEIFLNELKQTWDDYNEFELEYNSF